MVRMRWSSRDQEFVCPSGCKRSSKYKFGTTNSLAHQRSFREGLDHTRDHTRIFAITPGFVGVSRSCGLLRRLAAEDLQLVGQDEQFDLEGAFETAGWEDQSEYGADERVQNENSTRRRLLRKRQ